MDRGGSVAIFLTVSAYLFGVKWRGSGCIGFQVVDFIKKRSLRIFIPLWLTLLFAIPLELYAGHELNTQMVFLNFFGLGWFSPLMWNGHLWYITMTLIMYISFLLISRIRFLSELPIWAYVVALVGFSAVIVVLPNMFASVFKTIVPLTLLYATMMFTIGDKILELCRKNKKGLLFLTVFLLCTSYYLHCWQYDLYKGLALFFSALFGLFTFLTIMTFMKLRKQNRAISWLSKRSYEIYLIHPSMMCIALIWMGKSWMDVSVGIVMIVASGYVVNTISSQLYKLTNNSFKI